MIDYIEGKLSEKEINRVVVDVNGIGYSVFVSLGGHEKLPELGEKVKLLTYFHVREDIQQLFGFIEKEERKLFRLLINVNGIGPKLAMGILSGIRLEELKQAIYTENLNRLNAIPGVGKKTAERIVLELKGKMEESIKKDKTFESSSEMPLLNEALLALVSLGYNQAIAQKAIKKTLQQDGQTKSVEDLVRKSLNNV